MCMVYDENDNVLALKREDKNWGGIVFPGGHVEKDEPFTDAVIREVFEETGLTIKNPKLCGIKSWTKGDCRYIVLLYKANQFTGELAASDEGEVLWMKRSEVISSKSPRSFSEMLRVFLEDDLGEHYLYEEDGEWISVLK